MSMIKFQFDKQEWKIARTDHLYDKRGNSDYQRDAFLDDTRYIKIMKRALINGLTSFRNKGKVVVTVPSYAGKHYSILCSLGNKNKIVIISVYYAYKDFWKTFIKERNRINMVWERNPENLYIVPKMNEKERGFKDLDTLFYNVSKSGEDTTFKNVMDQFIDYKIK